MDISFFSIQTCFQFRREITKSVEDRATLHSWSPKGAFLHLVILMPLVDSVTDPSVRPFPASYGHVEFFATKHT